MHTSPNSLDEFLAHAKNRLERLLPAEEEMLRRLLSGEEADFRNGDEDGPHLFEEWDDQRDIRSDCVSLLCRSSGVRSLLPSRGICISCANILGELKLHRLSLPIALELPGCRFEMRPRLTAASFEELSFSGAMAPGFSLDRVTVRGSLLLCNVIVPANGIALHDARVFRNIDLRGARLDCSSRDSDPFQGESVALGATNIRVGGSVILDEGFTAHGINLADAEIGTNLNMRGATIYPPRAGTHRHALFADRMRVRGSILFCFNDDKTRSFESHGTISIASARVGGDIDATAAHLEVAHNDQSVAFHAPGIRVDGNVRLRSRFTSVGAINLVGARIRGVLDLDNCRIDSGDRDSALRLDRAHIGGSVFIRTNPNDPHVLTRSAVQSGTDTVSPDVKAEISGSLFLQAVRIGGYLLCNGAHLTNPNESAIDISGAHIDGNVELCNTHISGCLRCQNSDIGGSLDCTGARFSDPKAMEGDLYSIGGVCTHVGRDMLLRHGFCATGSVNVAQATVGGRLDCTNGHFLNENRVALAAGWTKIGGSVLLMTNTHERGGDRGFQARGKVDLHGSTIAGSLDCNAGHFENRREIALYASRLHISGSVCLHNGFLSEGRIVLVGASIGGDLMCRGGAFYNPRGVALNVGWATIAGNALLTTTDVNGTDRIRFSARGEVNLQNSVVDGNLECNGGRFSNPGGTALNIDRIRIHGSAFLGSTRGNGEDKQRFIALGVVRLQSASIRGNLECLGGRFINPGGKAFHADGIRVDGYALLSHGFRAEGQVRLPSAQIGHDLNCRAGVFSDRQENNGDSGSGERYALYMPSASVGADVFLRATRLSGLVSLASCDIRGSLYCQGARFITDQRAGIRASGVHVARSLEWRKIEGSSKAILDVRNGKVGQLDDDETSWPSKGDLQIHGFSYQDLSAEAPTDPRRRCDWLGRQPSHEPFRPQPYEQLAEVLRRNGHEHEAKWILMEKHSARRRHDRKFARDDPEGWRRAGGMRWHSRAASKFLSMTIGHGHRTRRAAGWALGIIALGWALFNVGHRAGLISPTSPYVYMSKDYTQTGDVPDEHPVLSPLVYSLDTFVPIVDLHQEAYWLPDANKGSTILDSVVPTGRLLRIYLWLHTGAGWVLTTLAVAGLAGVVRKEE